MDCDPFCSIRTRWPGRPAAGSFAGPPWLDGTAELRSQLDLPRYRPLGEQTDPQGEREQSGTRRLFLQAAR
jgi:hypothetical protein